VARDQRTDGYPLMPHRARRVRRDSASVGCSFTCSVGQGTSPQHRTQASQTAPSPPVGIPLLYVTTTVKDNARRPSDLHACTGDR